ncbi:hypothetical protein KKH39_02165 [Patescibacteria group bacterium]|nr:hypothetical protein [Patescibacteria group bacterium]
MWLEVFKQTGALWLHDNNPQRPHALLTSGLHSNGFVNCSLIIRNPALLEKACWHLANQANWLHNCPYDMVIGSAMGGVTLAYQLALSMEKEAGFTEKVDNQMLLKRFPLKPGTRVLMVEDVMTTGKTTRQSIAGISEAGGIVSHTILALVNRSGLSDLDGRKIISLIAPQIDTWQPQDCPLCLAGSEAIRPKGREEWLRLRGNYPV